MYVLATTPGDAHVVNTKMTPLEPSTQWKSSPRINSNAPLKVVVSLELIVKYTELYIDIQSSVDIPLVNLNFSHNLYGLFWGDNQRPGFRRLSCLKTKPLQE